MEREGDVYTRSNTFYRQPADNCQLEPRDDLPDPVQDGCRYRKVTEAVPGDGGDDAGHIPDL